VGLEDPENELKPDRFFGWDNEKPKRNALVPSFQAKARPITNQEYALYLEETNKQALPASWIYELPTNSITQVNGDKNSHFSGGYLRGKFVRTFFGKLPLAQALHWPAIAS